MDVIPVRRALVSVSDKMGLSDLCLRLAAAGVEIVSSGGTADHLTEAGIPVTAVTDVTGTPEMLGGRVKTLHPTIHGGILARPDRADDRADLERHQIRPFELVVVNLYPFAHVVARPEATEEMAVENIDVGGPAMIRAAAKNHRYVGVVTSPQRYHEVATAVEAGGLSDDLRLNLAREAFYHTASYDAAILAWLERGDPFPPRLVLPLRRQASLRYGENPHQAAALYSLEGTESWWGGARIVQGKEMSFNNYLDTEAAWRLASAIAMPAAVIVKHNNPCGVATAEDCTEAFRAAWECDPQSAFGGVVAINRPLPIATAEAIAEHFVEVVVAPGLEDPAALAGRPNLRVVLASRPPGARFERRGIDGGLLVQEVDPVDDGEFRHMTSRPPTAEELADLRLALVVAAHAKSNSVVVARHRAAVGVGAGDQSRVGAVQRALARAGDRAKGAVAASDGFFPFRDAIDALAAAGIAAVVAPSGSRNDEDVATAAEDLGLSLLFADRRHFRH